MPLERERLNISDGGERTNSCSVEGRKRQEDGLLEQSVAQTSPREIAFYKVPANCRGFLQAADGRREQRSRPPDVWARGGKSWNRKNDRGTASLQVVCFQWKVAS